MRTADKQENVNMCGMHVHCDNQMSSSIHCFVMGVQVHVCGFCNCKCKQIKCSCSMSAGMQLVFETIQKVVDRLIIA